MIPFIPLHVHSHYSPMRGVSTLEALCGAARAQGADALALTDTNGLYGAVRFVDVARQHGLQPILGAEITHGFHRAVLLVKNNEGHANLCRLLSARHGDDAFHFIEAVRRWRSGLIAISDDRAALEAWKKDSADDLYVELTPAAGMEQAFAFSRAAKIPPVASQRAHFVNPDEYRVHRLLRAIDLNTTLSRLPESACVSPLHRLAPVASMKSAYANVPEALANTARVAESCLTEWRFKEMIFPNFRALPDREAFGILKEKTYAGALRCYGKLTGHIRARIGHELAIIADKKFAHYFLVVEEIVRQAPLACGRGSAAGSVVAYCLGITQADPIRHRLLFERFLNASRNDPPDIDIDFPWDERNSMIQWIFERYGARRVAMVGNQNFLGFRSAIREVAKVYGIAPAEIDRVAPLITKEMDLLRLAESPGTRRWAESLFRKRRLREPWSEILDLALRVEGHFRNLGLHCGGIVIAPDEIRKYAPVEISAKGIPVAQWDKDQVEDSGLVKIDLLGNRSLSVIRDVLSALEKNLERPLDYENWNPLADERTQALIRSGDTLGCFNIESPATRLLLKKLWSRMPDGLRKKADVFEYLVMAFALVRPAAISFVRDFIRRAHGECYEPLHPILEEILKDNHGIMLYQEDVTKVAMALAGFSVEDAEQLRKILSKKNRKKTLRDFQVRFYRVCREREVSPAKIDLIWSMVLSFAGYSFCKPHAVSYAHIAFRCAFLRAHFPAEFMAAVISNEGGFYPKHAYISEARRMGLGILLPDINSSERSSTGAGETLRLGLMEIKGLNHSGLDRLLAERKAGGPFRSFEDFWQRARPQLAQARLLIKAGCLDSISGGLNRPALLWRAHALTSGKECGRLPVPPDYSKEQKLRHQIETLGFLPSHHPMAMFQSKLEGIIYVPAREMARHAGRSVTMVGCLIAEKMTQTQKGDPMAFATFEDHSSLYEATFFPASYRRCYHLLGCNRPYLLRGTIEHEFGAATLNVREIEPLDGPPSKWYVEAEVFSSEGKHGEEKRGQTEPVGGRFSTPETHQPGGFEEGGSLLQRLRPL